MRVLSSCRSDFLPCAHVLLHVPSCSSSLMSPQAPQAPQAPKPPAARTHLLRVWSQAAMRCRRLPSLCAVLLLLLGAGFQLPAAAQTCGDTAAGTTCNICARTEQIETALLTELGLPDDDSACATVLNASLASIVSFSVTGTDLVSLTYHDFGYVVNDDDLGGLTGLKTLNLSNNAIEAFEENQLMGVTSLETLDISGNQINFLADDLFEPLPNLVTLNLNDNFLTTSGSGNNIRAAAFTSLSNLKNLYLRGNNLSPGDNGAERLRDAIDNLTGLESLDIGNAAITALPFGMFADLTNLKMVAVHGNELVTIRGGVGGSVFAPLKQLEIVSFSGNMGSQKLEVPDGRFNGLTNLKILDLSNNLAGAPTDFNISYDLAQVGSADYRVSSTFGGAVAVAFSWSAAANQSVFDSGAVVVEAGAPSAVFTIDLEHIGLTTEVIVTLGQANFHLPQVVLSTEAYAVYAAAEVLGSTNALGFDAAPGVTLSIGVSQAGSSQPAFAQTGYTFLLTTFRLPYQSPAVGTAASTVVSTVLGTVSANDADGDSLHYSIAAEDSAYFTVGEDSGELRYTADRTQAEATPSYTLTLRANDDSHFTTPEVTVLVEFIDFPAAFTFSLAEGISGTADAYPVGTISSLRSETDSSIHYRLDEVSLFSVSVTGGVVSYIGSGEDFESGTTFRILVVTAADASDPTLFDTAQVTVTIATVPPLFTEVNALYSFALQSTETPGVIVGTVLATDDNQGQSITYSIVAGGLGKLSISAEGGVLSYIGSGGEDVTLTPSYTLIVRAIEDSPAALFADATVQVSVGICDRTPPVQNYIVNNFSSISACTDATAAKLAVATGNNGPNVTRILNDITSLKSWDFAGLIDLGGQLFLRPPLDETYGVAIGGMTSLPEGVFTDLNNLDILDVSSHRFSSLPSGVFVGLNNLTHLQLDNQADNILDASPPSSTKTLSSLAAGVFNGLGKLEELNLAYNNLSSWPAGVFNGLSKLERLNLAYNNLSSLPAGVFNGLSSLTRVDLSRNPGRPFSINLVPQQELGSATEVRVSSSMAAVGITVRWTASGSASATETDTVAISAGATTSGVITLTALDHAIFALSGAAFAATQLVSRGNVYDENYGLALTVSSISLGRTPAFIFPHYTFSLGENQPGTPTARLIGTVSASDADGNAVSYRIAAGATALFSIGADSGVVSYIGSGEDAESTPSYTLSVQATDSSSHALSATVAVTVSIANVNDTDPVFGDAPYTFSLGENQPGTPTARLIGTVSASDADGSTVSYRIEAGATALFSVGIADGVVSYIGSGEDFETTDSYTLTVQATDSDSSAMLAMAAVVVTIINANDNAPLFASAAYIFTLREGRSGTEIPVFFGTVSASDADGDTVSYSIEEGATALFSVGIADGVVSYIGSGEDFEPFPSFYVLILQASDGELSALFATVEVTVILSDANDVPVFVGAPYTFSLAENDSGTPNARLIGTVVARDADAASASPSYNLSAGETSNFSVDSASGVVSYIGTGEDYEARSDAYTLAVQATDGDSSDLFVFATVTVLISNENDNAPVFASAAYTFTLREGQSGTEIPVFVGTVSATDAEADAAEYSLSGGDTARFSIGSASGVVSYIGSGEDAESTPSYTLTVRASDGALSSAVAITIEVIADQPPQFSAAGPFFLTATNRASLGTVVATDANNDPITYSLVGNPEGKFSVVTASGVVSYLGTGIEDVTFTNSYALTVRASDDSGFTEVTATVRIGICDRTAQVREGIVSLISSVSLCESVTEAELTAVTDTFDLTNQTITSLVAIDFAGLGSLKELFLHGNQLSSLPAGVFGGLSSLRTLWLTNNNQLRSLPAGVFAGLSNLKSLYMHKNRLGSLPAGVFAGLGNLESLYMHDNRLSSLPAGVFAGLSNLTTLRLNNNDLSSLPAGVFAGLTSLTSLSASSNPGADFSVSLSLERISASEFRVRSDFPGPAYSSVTWEASGGSLAETSGTVTIAAGTTSSVAFVLPPSTYTTIELTGSSFASGFYGFTTSLTAAFTINLPPLFAPTTYVFSLEENQLGPVIIGTVSASNTDGGGLSYSLVSADTLRFSIGATSGLVSYIGSSEDYESTVSYTLTVQASDNEFTDLTASAAVTVLISNENDNAPLFAAAPYSFTVPEGQSGTQSPVVIGSVSASDADGVVPRYSLSAGATERFSVGSASGVVSYIGTGEDYETRSDAYTLTVRATDGASAAVFTAAEVTVLISNENDNAPLFAAALYSFTVPEGQSGTQSPVVIGSVSASDADGVAPLYSLSAGATERFSVGSASGVVSYIGTGEDYETRSDAYTLTVRATDGASAAVFTAAEVTVLISNENDNAPLFAAAPYSFTVPEGQSGTQSPVVIGSVSASDADGVAPLYSLSAGATERFSVGSASGVVSYIGTGEDFETRSDAYTLTVRATDGASAAVFTAAEVTVLISNENDNAPLFAAALYSFTVPEGQSGTQSPVVIGSVSASDADGVAPLYSLSAGATERFSVGSASGVVSYIGTGEDFETRSDAYTLTVRATDGASAAVFTAAEVTVLISNENDNAPLFAAALYSFTVPEGQSGTQSPVVIGSVSASDADGVAPLYSLSAGATERFSVGSASGVVSYIGTGEDFETRSDAYTLTVRATDGASAAVFTAAEVTVLISNENDNAPLFAAALYSFTVPEGQSGTQSPVVIGSVSASDADGVAPLYSLSAGATERFSVGSASGVVSYIGTGEDFETRSDAYTLTVRATDGASAAVFTAAEVTVLISNENDNAPLFAAALYSFTVPEGQSGTQSPVVIGSVSASDADGVAPLYSLSAGATERFSVGSASGVVSYIGTGEDFETRSDAYTLTVRATDGASAAVFTAAEVTVLISNENDNAPLFAAALYSFTVPEGQSGTQSPVVIGSVSASDADGVAPLYSLSAGATERFSVGSASGVVSYIGTGEDFETRSDAYTLTVRATDGASAAVFTAAEVTVLISNENDNAPLFAAALYSFTVPEGQSGTQSPVVIGSVSASDADGVAPLYSLSAGATERFSVGSASGVVSYIGTGEDFETRSDAYTLTVRATDGASAAVFTAAEVTVLISNENDNAPLFAAALYSFTVPEGQSGTQSPVVIGSVSASDADGVAPLYSLSAGATERFSVGSASGVVSYIGTGEDFETRSDAYTLTVRATDGASAAVFTAAEVTVLISNENDNAPLFAAAPYSFTVPEGQSGTQSPVVIGSVSASDADGVAPRYSLSAGATERFSVGSASGVVSYIGTGEDFETRSDAYTLTVRATDGASAAVFTAAEVTVLISNENDNAPLFAAAPYSFTVPEGQSGTQSPVVIGSVSASDADGVAPLYSLSAGATERFSVGSASGVVSYIGTGEDFETRSDAYTLTVRATDGASAAVFTAAEVTVLISNENDNAPLFASAAYSFTLREGQSGTDNTVFVGSVSARDADGVAPGYSLLIGDTDRFSVGSASGVVSYIGTGEDFETRSDAYTLTVRATDGASAAVFTAAEVTVLISNENDNAPLFAAAPYSFTVPEGQSGTQSPVVIGSVSASDADGVAPLYSLSAGATERFSVGSASGVVSYIGTGEDFETRSDAYTLTVRATDGASAAVFTAAEVTVLISNENDNAPLFAAALYSFTVPEGQSGTQSPVVIGSVSASDADGVAPLYSLSAGATERFSVGSASGVVSYIGTGEDFETRSDAYTLTVRATDGASAAVFTAAEVTVLISNENDNAPLFAAALYSFTVPEGQSGTQSPVVIGSVSASDADGVAPLYSLSAGATERFSVGSASGVVSYIGTGEDFETRSDAYTLTVRATDGASAAVFTAAEVTVLISNENDNAPLFAAALYSFTVPEGQSGTQSPVVIGSVSASDADGVAPLYSLSAGATERFSVGSASGVVSYIGTGEDFETRSDAYTLTVRATDGASAAVFTAAEVTVLISNENDNAPLFAAALSYEALHGAQGNPAL